MSKGIQRRLAAILAADVAGYSRLMGEDEAGTLNALRHLRTKVFAPTVDLYRGTVVKSMGDGWLVEFASIADAVECAIAVQEGLVEHERIRLRIGVHLGDVTHEDEDIYGDGVNIAARLQQIAEPGAIVISDTTRRSIDAKLAAQFADLGSQELKNIAEPIVAYGTGMIGKHVRITSLPLPDKPSIAVMPFTNMSGDVDQDYFADGMVEDIITGLARIKWLFVISRNSSFTYKGKAVDVTQVGRELGVRYVLEGSVRKASNHVRVTGQLIEAENGRHVWADRYDRTLDDVFAIQDELTMSVVAAIEPSLRQAEIERIKRKRPDNLDAYDLVLRAIPHVYPAMPDGATKALPFLETALNMEAGYGLAHGFAAWCHQILFARGGAREENRLGAAHHAQAAIAYGRDDAIALSLGGFAMGLVAHDREAARQAFEAALALSSSCALAYMLGSVVMVFGGDADRAIEWGERAIRLSPFDPMSYSPWFSICLGHFQCGEYEAAAEAAHKVFQANPYWSSAHYLLAATQAKLDRLNAAKSAAMRVLELEPSFTISGLCAAFDIHPSLAAPLSKALSATGLPA